MTSPQNSLVQTPAAANLVQAPAEVGLAATVGNLLRSEELANMPEADQGAYIIDRFIGQLAANGGVESSSGIKNDAPTLLKKIDAIAMTSKGDGPMSWDNQLKQLSRGDGFRHAVHLLGTDARTGNQLGSLSRRIVVLDGKLAAFGSLDQVNGYLDNKNSPSANNATDWRQTIATEITGQVTGTDKAPPRRKLRDNLSSDVPSVRADQQKWESAVSTAREAGVDMDLLYNSEAEMQKRHQQGLHIGQTVMQYQVEAANYDHLFQA